MQIPVEAASLVAAWNNRMAHTKAIVVGETLSWHSLFYCQAYTDFLVPVPSCATSSTYWVTVGGNVIYRLCLIVFWATLNVFAIPFGVIVEPLWRRGARFHRLQFPGRIPVISVALPILLSYAAYCTGCIYGLWHVILPFIAMVIGGVFSIGLLVCFQTFKKRERILRRAPHATRPEA